MVHSDQIVKGIMSTLVRSLCLWPEQIFLLPRCIPKKLHYITIFSKISTETRISRTRHFFLNNQTLTSHQGGTHVINEETHCVVSAKYNMCSVNFQCGHCNEVRECTYPLARSAVSSESETLTVLTFSAEITSSSWGIKNFSSYFSRL
jgi:hypothetical protein